MFQVSESDPANKYREPEGAMQRSHVQALHHASRGQAPGSQHQVQLGGLFRACPLSCSKSTSRQSSLQRTDTTAK